MDISSASSNTAHAKATASMQQSAQAQKLIQQLKASDQIVRRHELAHLSAAGGIATSGPSYQYQRGPDGQLYAVGGEVQIDASPVPNDPLATIRKAEQIRRAALAPADPSGQDVAVAAAAVQMLVQAQAELAQQQAASGKAGAYAKTGADPSQTGSLIDVSA